MDEPKTPGLFAERLERLFAAVTPAHKKRWTNEDVANAINEAAGERIITFGHISHLRTGKRDNPGYHIIAALAAFFGVPPQYFFDDPTAKSDGARPVDLELEVALKNDAVRQIALRAAGLSAETLNAIQAMIDSARTIERRPRERPTPRGSRRRTSTER